MHADTTRPAVTMLPSGVSISRADLEHRVAQFATVLRPHGEYAEQRVAVLLGNQLEYAIVALGARGSGSDYLPLKPYSNTDDLLHILGQFKPTVLVVSDAFSDKAKVLGEHCDSSVRRIMVGKPAFGWESFQELLDEVTAPLPAAEYDGRQLLLSGGSTGRPKIVLRRSKRLAAHKRQVRTMVSIGPSDVIQVTGHLYHAMPLNWVMDGFDAGAQVVVLEDWDTELSLRCVEEYGVTVWSLVPTMMYRLLDLPDEIRFKYDISSLKAVVHGAAPCSPVLKEQFMQWFPNVWEGYGMSEGFGMTAISPAEWRLHPGSVGKTIGSSYVVIRDEDGNELPPGVTGIIWFGRRNGQSDRMTYLGNQSEADASYNEHGEGTALDLGYVDEDGYLYIVGRLKSMVIVGTTNVFPEVTVEALLRHTSVADAHVLGEPDPEYGEVLVAIVQLQDSCTEHEAMAKALTDHCRQIVGELASPRRYVFTDRLPRETTGKINSSKLRELVSTS